MKQKTIFTCHKCGSQSPKWLGKCPDCGAWNSMAEEIVVKQQQTALAGVRSYPVPICDVPTQFLTGPAHRRSAPAATDPSEQIHEIPL